MVSFDLEKKQKRKIVELLSTEEESCASSSDEEISFRREVVIEEQQQCSSGSKHGDKMSFVHHPSIGEWVEVMYDNEMFTGAVTENDDDEWKIRCLTHLPNGYYHLECDNASVWYRESDILGKCDNVPILVNAYKELYTF